jgi:hypothetical protein
VDYELAVLGRNSIKIIPSAIGYIPDIYENEVRSLVWARQNPDSAGTLAALTQPSNHPTKISGKFAKSTRQASDSNIDTSVVVNKSIEKTITDPILPKFATMSLQQNQETDRTLPKNRNQPPFQMQKQTKLDSSDVIASISKSNYQTTYQSSFQSHPRN